MAGTYIPVGSAADCPVQSDLKLMAALNTELRYQSGNEHEWALQSVTPLSDQETEYVFEHCDDTRQIIMDVNNETLEITAVAYFDL